MPSGAVVYLTLVQMRARGDKGVALLEDAAFGSIAQTIVSATNRLPLDLLGFKRCKNVLRYVRAWRQVYATAHACVTPTPNSVQSFTPNNVKKQIAPVECLPSVEGRFEIAQQMAVDHIGETIEVLAIIRKRRFLNFSRAGYWWCCAV